MTVPATQAGLLFGVTTPVYQSPLGASFGLMAAAPQALGAELLVVSDALSGADSESGAIFKNAVDTYRSSLRKGNLEDVQACRSRLSEIVKGLPEQTWTKTVSEVAKTTWATQGGFFATRPFGDFRPFSSTAIQPSSSGGDHFLFLEARGRILTREQGELPAILLHSDPGTASQKIQEWMAICQECYDQITGHGPGPEFRGTIADMPILLNYVHWFCTLLDRQSLIFHHFGYRNKDLEEWRARIQIHEGLILMFLRRQWDAAVAYAKGGEVLKASADLLLEGGDLVALAHHHTHAAWAFQKASEMFDATAAIQKSLEMAKQSAALHGKAAVIFRGLQRWNEFGENRNLQVKIMEGIKKRYKKSGEHESVLEVIEEALQFAEDDLDHLQPDASRLLLSAREYKLTQLLDKAMTCKSLGQLEESESALEKAIDLLMELGQHYTGEGDMQKAFQKFGLFFSVETERESLLLQMGKVAEAISTKILVASLGSSMMAQFQRVDGEDPTIRKNQQTLLAQFRKKYDEVREELEKQGRWETVKKVLEAAGISFTDERGQLLHPVASFFHYFEMLRNLVLGKGFTKLYEEMGWFEEIVRELNSDEDEMAQEVANFKVSLVGDVFTIRDSSGNTLNEMKIGDPDLLSQMQARLKGGKGAAKN